MGNLYLGTSGWSYDDWIGILYDSKEKMLSTYWDYFNTVEINSTFYSYPKRSFILYLSRFAPPDFVFTAKLPKEITHTLKLNPSKGVAEKLSLFLDLMLPLKESGHLGPILIQLPPEGPQKLPHFEDFLTLLDSNFMWSVEFRDTEWLTSSVFRLLEKYNIAYCIVDEPLLPPKIEITSRFSYIRWHGRGKAPWYYYLYHESELKEWVPRVNEILNSTDVVYAYFNNHFRGFAVINALQFLQLLGKATPNQLTLLKEIDEKLKKPRLLTQKLPKNKEFSEVELLLLKLVELRRFERGKTISDDLVTFTELTSERISGTIKNYEFLIDVKGRRLNHNCDDWKKRVQQKKLCKHMVKVFLLMPKSISIAILRDIIEHYDSWIFE